MEKSQSLDKKLKEMTVSKLSPPVPNLVLKGAAQDIVGVAKLLEASDIGLTFDSQLASTTEGAITKPERLGSANGILHGEELSFHLNPASNDGAVRYFAAGVTERLNILAAALDPNFEYLQGVTATVYPGGYYLGNTTETVLVDLQPKRPERTGSTLGRHESLGKSLKARQELIWNDKYAGLVMETLAERPTWNAIAAAFETMKTDLDVGKLSLANLMTAEQENEFGKAANNRTDRMSGSRHGITAKNQKLDTIKDHFQMMTLLEARELHRQAIHRYLDRKTGHVTGYEVVDNIGYRMAFGLHEWKRSLLTE